MRRPWAYGRDPDTEDEDEARQEPDGEEEPGEHEAQVPNLTPIGEGGAEQVSDIGAGAVTSAWSTVPPSSIAGAGLEERPHEDTVSKHLDIRDAATQRSAAALAGFDCAGVLLDRDQVKLTEIRS